MTTTLSPRLTQIYSNIIIESIGYQSNCTINDTDVFPIAEKREDDLNIEDDFEIDQIARYDYTGNNRERYRYLRAVDLVTEDLQSKGVYMNSYGFLYDGLEIFYETLNKSDKDSDFRANLYEILNKKVWRWGTKSIKKGLGIIFDTKVSDCCTMQYFFKRYSHKRLEKKLEKDYKRYIKLILKINARMFKKDGRVYPDEQKLHVISNFFVKQTNWEEQDQIVVKRVLESEDMWQAFCSYCPFLYSACQQVFSTSAGAISRYQYQTKVWLKK